MAGEDQHLDARMVGSNLVERFKPTSTWHREVHDDDVGISLLQERQCGCAVTCLAHDLKIVFARKQRSNTGADHRVIVNDGDACPGNDRPMPMRQLSLVGGRCRHDVTPRQSPP